MGEKMTLSDKREELFIQLYEELTENKMKEMLKVVFANILIQDKQAVKELKEEDEMFEIRIIGFVWGLCSKEPFNSKFFNNRFNELLRQHHKNRDKIFGELK